MKPILAHALTGFDSITLDQLNSTMSLMERVDTKYVINYEQADQLIQTVKDKFFVLQIKEKVIFKYDNIYMDTEDNRLFYEHEDGHEMRNKVRTRNYTDSQDLCFFEYKHKLNKVTRKFRYKCPAVEHGIMTEEAEGFFSGVYESLNGEVPEFKLTPSLATRYNRITLCAKNSGEKLTIDFGFEFEDVRTGVTYNLDDIVIVESKSNSEHCVTGKVLKKMKVRQAKGCSKYCLGLLYTGRISKSERFKETMEYIDTLVAQSNEDKDRETKKVLKKATRQVSKIAKETVANAQIDAPKQVVVAKKTTFKTKKLATA